MSVRSPDAAQRAALAAWCAADPGSMLCVGPGSAEQRYTLHRVRDTREVTPKEKAPTRWGKDRAGPFLSGRISRTSACTAPGLIVQVVTLSA